MNLSLGIGLILFVVKVSAYLLTGSAAILSDAAESVVHVAAVFFAAYSLRVAHRPADQDHLYGHAKIAFFSAGFEGAMIILAAIYIIYESIHKWMTGLKLENLGAGTLLTAAAVVINGALGAYLVWLGRKKESLILKANGKHVLTDCWTSAAVLVGLGLTLFTGWLPWDPICGVVMAINILVSGTGLIRSALAGLMDQADPEAHRALREILDRETARHGISYHELRHRNVGDAQWVEVHFLFPEGTSLRDAHRTATAIEQTVEDTITPKTHVTSHLECRSDHHELHPHERQEG
ncbi:MAG: cation transporter [Verrucomicrobiales bacterium]|nr:cation transporter [Verrucomicrobiales bacterium]